ncbi:MAG: hypothetical protein ACJ752_00585 [Gaiellaceae bacterium]
MSETFTEAPTAAPAATEAAPETPAADLPRSPSEAVSHYAEQARSLAEAAPETAPEQAADLQLSDELFPTEQPWDELPDEYRQGYTSALEALGITEPDPPQPGDPEYATWAQAESERLAGENRYLAEQIAERAGVTPEHVEAMFAQRAEWQRQQDAAELSRQVNEHAANEQVAHHRISQIGQEIGADYLDPASVLDVARRTHAEVSRQYGADVADQLADRILQEAARSQATEIEAVAEYGIGVVNEYAAHLGPNALDREQQVEVLAQVEDRFPRALRDHGGDESAALERAFSAAVDRVAGPPTHPRAVTARYAAQAQRIHEAERGRAPQPTPEPNHFGSSRELVDFYAKRARELAKEGQ